MATALRSAEGQRLVLVSLADVDLKTRLKASARLRAQEWMALVNDPYKLGRSTSESERLDSLLSAALIEAAAYRPSRRKYAVSSDAAAKVIE